MAESDRPVRPNVLWILADQMRGQAMSHMGDANVHTPELDLLAAQGLSFHRALSGTPVCTPFRGALLTGRYGHQTGVVDNAHGLPPAETTVAHTLGAHGYRTGWFGKWHLDGAPTAGDPPDRERVVPAERRGGFADWWGYQNNNNPFAAAVHGDGPGGPETRRLQGYETDALTDLLLEWIGADSGSPFFGVLSVQPPHPPYVAPPEDLARHHPAHLAWRGNVPDIPRIRQRAGRELAGYYAAIERLDRNLGRIRRRLAEQDLADHTYILFFSDHGDMHGSHGLFRKSLPFEEAVRIPLVVGGPPLPHQNFRECDELVAAVDLAPTTCGLCGIAPPRSMPGHDFSPQVRRRPDPVAAPAGALLSLYGPAGVSYGADRAFRGVVSRDGWKYVALAGQPWLLFNLNEDPWELANLALQRAFQDERRQLQGLLGDMLQACDDSFPLPQA